MSELILGLDAGNFSVKVAGLYGTLSFSSAICDWFERDIVENYEDDMEFKIGNRRGFAGTVAKYEDVYGGEVMFGISKAHDDTKVKVLLGIYRYMQIHNIKAHNISIVVGQPIGQHKESDKEFIKKMLLGYHEYEVNGQTQAIRIENVGVAAEGSSAYWSNPVDGVVRIIDIGSGTSQAATIIDKRHINVSSESFNFGAETGKDKREIDSVVKAVIRGTTRLQWNRNDSVYVCGGIAEEASPLVQQHYPNTRIMQPILKGNGGETVVDSTYANAVGFYNIAKGVFT